MHAKAVELGRGGDDGGTLKKAAKIVSKAEDFVLEPFVVRTYYADICVMYFCPCCASATLRIQNWRE